MSQGMDGVEFVVLELSPVSHMDAMGAAWMEEIWQNYRAKGIQLVRGRGVAGHRQGVAC